MNQEAMKRISTWGTITGGVGIIGGIALVGTLFIGDGSTTPAFALLGAILFYFGYLTLLAGKEAKKYLAEPSEEAISNVVNNYGKFLLVLAVVMIVSVIFILLGQ